MQLDPDPDVEGLSECGELFLAQFDLLVEFALVHDQFGLHGDKVGVVGELVVGQVFGQEARHLPTPPVNVLLEPLRLVQLLHQLVPLALQSALQSIKKKGQR